MIEAKRKKADKESSFRPAIFLKLYIPITLYVAAVIIRMEHATCLNLFMNQKQVTIPLGKHPKNILAMKMCSVMIPVINSMAARNAMIWLKMDLFCGSPPKCS